MVLDSFGSFKTLWIAEVAKMDMVGFWVIRDANVSDLTTYSLYVVVAVVVYLFSVVPLIVLQNAQNICCEVVLLGGTSGPGWFSARNWSQMKTMSFNVIHNLSG